MACLALNLAQLDSNFALYLICSCYLVVNYKVEIKTVAIECF